ncbi:hypothetical protein BFJ63_vAg18100 [Fusarium oxysporum f. sp. narcissi]|uniref:Uncharacterized protein n=1 Tax=Fusarium oxysporum f. sp. narcissi TaxID=451672 RepID=A0A4Q2V2I9_FUSOX|nr:hypothetical protein BFJ63_vAg18100 [Fusarium oxysporum f. sp. narcissi]
MKMTLHDVRYSDLRKCIYEPPDAFIFKGLAKVPIPPVPGLDKGDSVSLCYDMQGTFPKDLLGNQSELDPLQVLPEVIEKTHIVEWEKHLKKMLKEAMKKPESPFYALQQGIGPSVQADITAKIQHCTHPDHIDHIDKLFTLACELHEQHALPALVFNYDRSQCEMAL